MQNIEVFKSAPRDCTDCELHKLRTQVVYPDLMKNSKNEFITLVIGEAPGKNEDLQGKPFIGRSGSLLREKLAMLPGTVLISNCVKCRPEKNRDPKASELQACEKYLREEISHYKPNLYLLIGRFACKAILPEKTKENNFQDIVGQIFEDKIPIIHPAATFYNPKNKEYWNRAWESVKEFINLFGKTHNIELHLVSPKKKKDLTNFFN
ncbi:MAG: uracil-DNA glycosylase [Candidatus Hodarchaeales archaeon]